MSSACAACSASLPADAQFCLQCGTKVLKDGEPLVDPIQSALEQALGSQYNVLRLLGQGGMGMVYLAREEALDRLVAVKVLSPGATDTKESRERFRREARTAAKLTHPNIVPLYTFGEADDMMYFVMGYVRGESLAARLSRIGKFSGDETRSILADIGGALHYAHKHGVVHRDIKPDNVLLDDESGGAMLTDFGIAKAQAAGGTLTELGAIVGTPNYMSPEQASGERTIDGRSDLYSLGVMAYHMLAGRLPFEGETFRDVLAQHISKPPIEIKTVEGSVPDDLARVVMRCLVKDPEGRWPEGHTLVQAMEQVDDDDEHIGGLHGNLDGIIPKALPVLAGTGVFWWLSYLFPSLRIEQEPWWAVAAILFALPVVLPLILAGVARYRGMCWRDMFRLAMRSPAKWPFWYPKRWRRDGDVWERLPSIVKRTRILMAMLLVFVVVPTLVYLVYHMKDAQITLEHPWSRGVMLGAVGLAAVSFFGSITLVSRWAQRHGLDSNRSYEIAVAPTGDINHWKKPRYAAWLLPPTASTSQAAASEPRTPEEYIRSIGQTAKELAGPIRAIGAEAESAAKQLLHQIDTLDSEIGKLARDVEPVEIRQLAEKISALGEESADDGDARRQIRQLLQSQLDLARRLETQLAAANERQTRQKEMLKTLWLRLADLRARQARDAVQDTEITGRIRILCQEIQAHADAAEEVRVLTKQDSGRLKD